MRQNSTMSINLFGFSTFYVVFGFLTHKKENIDQKKKCKNILNEIKQRQTNNFQFS